MLTFKRQTLVGAYGPDDAYLGKIHEKADGISLVIVRDKAAMETKVTADDLVTLAQISSVLRGRPLSDPVVELLGRLTAEEMAVAFSMTEEYGVRVESELQVVDDLAAMATNPPAPETVVDAPAEDLHDSVLEEDAEPPVDPAAATMIGAATSDF